jgi:RecG-like helicase
MPDFSTRLDTFPTVKKAHWYALKRLGIETVRDLFYHFPARYEDYSVTTPIADLMPDTRVTVEGTVTTLSAERTWKKKLLLTEATIEDATGNRTRARQAREIQRGHSRAPLQGLIIQDKSPVLRPGF